MLILMLKIAALLVLVVSCGYYARRGNKPVRRYPSADPDLEYYDRDYVVLSESIERAITHRQLDYAREFIGQFRTRYEPFQEPVELMYDVKNLRNKYQEKRRAISIRMQEELN
jgi:hypothetical protein